LGPRFERAVHLLEPLARGGPERVREKGNEEAAKHLAVYEADMARSARLERERVLAVEEPGKERAPAPREQPLGVDAQHGGTERHRAPARGLDLHRKPRALRK